MMSPHFAPKFRGIVLDPEFDEVDVPEGYEEDEDAPDTLPETEPPGWAEP